MIILNRRTHINWGWEWRVGGRGLGQKMENSLHMLAISSEITLQYSNESTRVNYNVKAKGSSKMSKE